MDEAEVARIWDGNADAWTLLSRMGCDRLRDLVNTPAFLEMLPEVSGLRGLDVGCGEGHHTRLLAERGARMSGVDISGRLLHYARERDREEGRGIAYHPASAAALPFADASFEFAVAVMSLMDMPDQEGAVSEIHRVLRPGGFLQLSITHPCFHTPRWEWIRDDEGTAVALCCGDYFRELRGETEEWTFGAAPQELKEKLPLFRIPRFTRTLSGWLNLLLDSGFTIERLGEPQASEEAIESSPNLETARLIAWVLHVRCRKGR